MFKQNIKTTRINQQASAKMSGVGQPKISLFDRKSLHKDSELVAISRALGISIEDLFEVVEDDN
ncbi:MAG: XRE family transcriptional regulator [Sporolactobacillus sp.]